jgi:Flp pilus assembly protein TadG
MLEAALVLPLLLLILFGTIELGRVANIQQTLDDAAREGARWSALPAAGSSTLPSPSDVSSRVAAIAAAQDVTLDSGDITVNQDVTASEGGLSTSFSEVDVSYNYTFLTPALASILPSMTLTARSRMRNETN